MHFQIAVNIICTFSCINHMYVFIWMFAVSHFNYFINDFVCTFVFNFIILFCLLSYLLTCRQLLCLCATLHFPDVRVTLTVPVLLHIHKPVIVWSFTFTEKWLWHHIYFQDEHCETFVISIITILGKLLGFWVIIRRVRAGY